MLSRPLKWSKLSRNFCKFGHHSLFPLSFTFSTSKSNLSEAISSSIVDEINLGNPLNYEINNIRNFSIIAHIDHGKSTLADALLEITGNISSEVRSAGQVCDTLEVERNRGITVKAQSASMIYKNTLLNMVDTPGHVDFSQEVDRGLATCQGAILLVDACQSIQAQTIDAYNRAKRMGIHIIPAVTKIDLPYAQPEECALNMAIAFNIDPESVLMTSAKAGTGVNELLERILSDIPPPPSKYIHLDAYNSFLEEYAPRTASTTPFMGRVVDCFVDRYRGVCLVLQSLQGELIENGRLSVYKNYIESIDEEEQNGSGSVQEVGILTPKQLRTGLLKQGQIGYAFVGLKSVKQARIGDILYFQNDWELIKINNKDSVSKAKTSPKSKKKLVELPNSMLYANIYPTDNEELNALIDALDKLSVNDSSLNVSMERSSSMGVGMRCGFLGVLHMEVTMDRLSNEYEQHTVVTSPSVPYIIKDRATQEEKTIITLNDWPLPDKMGFFDILEPTVTSVISCPTQYLGAIAELIKSRRALDIRHTQDSDSDLANIECILPLQEVVMDMADAIKSASSGYATFNYEEYMYMKAPLRKIDVTLNGKICDPLSCISHVDKVDAVGRRLAKRLKDSLSRQQFEIIVQAKIGSKIIARETIKPFRKNVLMKSGKLVGGGDETRKKKLLAKQREGKKRAKMIGNIEVNQSTLWSVLKK